MFLSNEKSKAALTGWLVLWVLFLPLVHIHPETDHAHGMPGHVHGGTFHTIVSSTPICAYQDHRHHHGSFSPGEPFGTTDSSRHVPHGIEHPVYGFSVLHSSLDLFPEESFSCSSANVAVVWTTALQHVFITASLEKDSLQPSPPTGLTTVSPRAPPRFSV